jgi:CRP-like cAMP-binding protein
MGLAQKKTSSTRQLLPEQLKEFVPIYSLDSERLQELARHATLITLPAGAKIFNRGDSDQRIFYLLSGSIELRNTEQSSVITSGTEEALLPIDPHQPRLFTVTTQSQS